MSAALGLFRLQHVDSQVDHIRARLKIIDETLHNDLELRAATDAYASAEAELKTAERDFKQSDAEVEKQRVKIQQAEASLYGGHVKTPKELQELQMDIASLKRHLETLESREIETMREVDVAEKALLSAKEALDRVSSEKSKEHLELVRESESLQKEIERLNSERSAVTSGLLNDSLEIYNRLRLQKRGVAVTSINDSSCAACGTTLTPAQRQNARSTSQLFNCPTCGRILFAN